MFVIALLGLTLVTGESQARADEAPVAAYVVSVAGKVQIRLDSGNSKKDAPSRLAKPGEAIRVGEVINTPSDGMIKLLLKDRSMMDLGPSTLFKLNAFNPNTGNNREVDSSLAYGSIRAAVTQKLEGKGSFRVRSPSATMGVRGTEFMMKSEMPDPKMVNSFMLGKNTTSSATGANSEPIKTEMAVLQGAVEVKVAQTSPNTNGATAKGPDGGVLLKAGTQMTTQLGGTTPPVAKTQTLTAEKMNEIKSSARIPDHSLMATIEFPNATKKEEAKAVAEEKRQQQQEKKEVAQEQTSSSVASTAASNDSKNKEENNLVNHS